MNARAVVLSSWLEIKVVLVLFGFGFGYFGF